MATARRGNGVSFHDRMRRNISKKLKGDIVGNWGELSTREQRYLEGIFGGTTKIAPRESRKMSAAQRKKMKVAILPFGTAVPATPGVTESYYFVGSVTKNSVGVFETCVNTGYQTAANWQTGASYTGSDIPNLKDGVWPAHIKGRYGLLEGTAPNQTYKKETVTQFDGSSVDNQVISYSATCIFGAEPDKLTGTSKEEVVIAAEVIEALKNCEETHGCLGVTYHPEFINVSSKASEEEFSTTDLPSPSFS